MSDATATRARKFERYVQIPAALVLFGLTAYVLVSPLAIQYAALTGLIGVVALLNAVDQVDDRSMFLALAVLSGAVAIAALVSDRFDLVFVAVFALLAVAGGGRWYLGY